MCKFLSLPIFRQICWYSTWTKLLGLPTLRDEDTFKHIATSRMFSLVFYYTESFMRQQEVVSLKEKKTIYLCIYFLVT